MHMKSIPTIAIIIGIILLIVSANQVPDSWAAKQAMLFNLGLAGIVVGGFLMINNTLKNR